MPTDPGTINVDYKKLLYSSTRPPNVATNKDGRLEIFVVGDDTQLYHIHQKEDGSGWSKLDPLGGKIKAPPVVGMNKDGRLEVFAVGAGGNDSQLHHIYQFDVDGKRKWGNWDPMGGNIAGSPVVGMNKDGRLEVFARGNDSQLYHIYQNVAGGGWGNWEPLGGKIKGNPFVAMNKDGKLEVFAVGADSQLYHIYQIEHDPGWGKWSLLSADIA